MNIGNDLSKIGGRMLLRMRKYSPEMLVGAGIVGGIGAAIWAVKVTASQHYREIAECHENELDRMKEIKETSENYTDKDFAQDVLTENISHYREIAKMYWKPTLLGAASIVSVLGGFKIIKSRNVALMAAYSVMDTAFKNYRNRVKEKLGEIADQELMHDMKTEKVKGTVKNADGTTAKVDGVRQILNGIDASMYGKVFDSNNPQWMHTNPQYNWFYVKKKRDYLNDKLRIRGHVFLNEVYEELGFEHTKAGSVTGWVKGRGDGYISFGPWCESITSFEALDGVVLDFNVDGVIWDMI